MKKNPVKFYDGIHVIGAREHNLKNISVKIPRNKITVITGLSGSGKSSLAFDTIYAEGQRRYMDGLSSYAKQFLDQLKKPEVDSITGLSPSISIEQKVSSTNIRSTVGTLTEVYDLLRILFAKLGTPKCPTHKIDLSAMSSDKIIDLIMNKKIGSKLVFLAPVARQKKGEFQKEFRLWFKSGFNKARVDGEFIDIDSVDKLKKTYQHNIDLVADRIILKQDSRFRVSQAVTRALEFGDKQLILLDLDSNEELLYSQSTSCPKCSFSFPDFSDPKFFSFNSPRGACPTCNGLGFISSDFGEEESFTEEDSEEEPSAALLSNSCGDCSGDRLRLEARNIFIQNYNISALCNLSISELLPLLPSFKFSDFEMGIAVKLLEELAGRLSYLDKMGVGYLSLNRSSRSLSGGESQRIRLASQIGSGLVGVLYVLDEPSIGLHPQDHSNLLDIIRELKDKGNTILLVEHDEETIRSADLIYDLGPGAGILGGAIQASGTPEEIASIPGSLTGKYLSGKSKAWIPFDYKARESHLLKLTGASLHNLKNLSVDFPLNQLISVTGLSGSGKSSLVIDTLFNALYNRINKSNYFEGPYKSLKGSEHIDRIIHITQKPIGRTPRSNPATYVGVFNHIRDLYAQLPDSKIRGFKPGHFSFNVKGGRCEDCSGAGRKKLEMNFMANVYVECDVCLGARYSRETQMIKYKGKSISEVLNMNISEAIEFFEKHPKIERILKTLLEVGLNYIHLGQDATTLSGGEAQRIKLSKELSKRVNRHSLYILDEPTTGLHFEDVHRLIILLQRLVTEGNTVVVIEHNLDVIRSSNYVIELGPKGGVFGGELVYSGSLAGLKKAKTSTSKFL